MQTTTQPTKRKGYYFDKVKNKYHVRVYTNGRNFHIGRFNTEQQASTARTEFIKRLEGEKL